LRRTRGSKLS